MMLEYPGIVIFLIGLACLATPGRFREFIKAVAMTGSLLTLACGIYGFLSPHQLSFTDFFVYKTFSAFIALAITFFCFVIVCFSMKYANFIEQLNQYYGFIFWCTAFSMFAVYSSNLIVLVVFWGVSGTTLYLLANLVPQASNASKKSFIIIGGSDAFMILGMAILWMLTGSFDIFNIRLALAQASPMATVSFLFLAGAALTKAGAMPFHSWIPDFAETVPMSLTAFLPGAIDKLMGIYLLVLICNQLFIITTAISLLLLLLGATTIVCAVYMAMIQHNIKKLLAYHAVSQVGYMILGIATGSPLGIAAGVFHMINNTIYKSALFLTGASVEHRAETTELDKLGGLGNYMPVTFCVCLIAALSISGIPPFNGFASKWMIYQSLVQQFTATNASDLVKICYLIFIVTAMFGSALTLASFVKLIHSVFMGQPSNDPEYNNKKISEINISMMLPMLMLAALCIVFGVFPYFIPLKRFIYPSLASFNIPAPVMIGFWRPYTATVLILAALICGVVVYAVGMIKFKPGRSFVGGEDLPLEAKASGPEFYRTVSDIGIFSGIYKMAEKKFFDIYDITTNMVLGLGRFLSFTHTGSLHTYLLLFLLGFAVVILCLR